MPQVKSKSGVESIAKTIGCLNPSKVSLRMTKTDLYPKPSEGEITADCPTCTVGCPYSKTKQRILKFRNIIKKPRISKCNPENCEYDLPCKECPRGGYSHDFK